MISDISGKLTMSSFLNGWFPCLVIVRNPPSRHCEEPTIPSLRGTRPPIITRGRAPKQSWRYVPPCHCEGQSPEAILEEGDMRWITTPFILHPSLLKDEELAVI